MYPPAAALINNGTVPLKRLLQKIYDKAFEDSFFLDEMMNKNIKYFLKMKTPRGNSSVKGKIETCQLMALRTENLCLRGIKLSCWGCDSTRPSWLSQMTPPPGRIGGDLGITMSVKGYCP